MTENREPEAVEIEGSGGAEIIEKAPEPEGPPVVSVPAGLDDLLRESYGAAQHATLLIGQVQVRIDGLRETIDKLDAEKSEHRAAALDADRTFSRTAAAAAKKAGVDPARVRVDLDTMTFVPI